MFEDFALIYMFFNFVEILNLILRVTPQGIYSNPPITVLWLDNEVYITDRVLQTNIFLE